MHNHYNKIPQENLKGDLVSINSPILKLKKLRLTEVKQPIWVAQKVN